LKKLKIVIEEHTYFIKFKKQCIDLVRYWNGEFAEMNSFDSLEDMYVYYPFLEGEIKNGK